MSSLVLSSPVTQRRLGRVRGWAATQRAFHLVDPERSEQRTAIPWSAATFPYWASHAKGTALLVQSSGMGGIQQVAWLAGIAAWT